MSRVDDMVHRILRTAFAAGVVDDPPLGRVVDPFKGASTAQRVAEQSSVLLKNANSLLPLDAARVKSIAIIGSRADTSVLSGGGSAQVDPPGGGPSRFGGPAVWFPSSPLNAVRGKAPRAKVEYHDGVDVKGAAAFAKASEIAIIFVNEYTTEGRDLPSLNLSGAQNELVSAVAAANPRTIVVLETGGPAAMPWTFSVGAAIEIWYPGIRGAEALANILFGDVNPSAKLPATFPRSDADLPHPAIFGSDQRPTPQATPPPGGVTAPPQRFQMKPFDIDYTEGLSKPSSMLFFDATEDKDIKLVGAASLTQRAQEGFIRRIAIKGDFAHSATMKKGIQTVDIEQAKAAIAGMNPVAITTRLNTDGQGIGSEAVVHDMAAPRASMTPSPSPCSTAPRWASFRPSRMISSRVCSRLSISTTALD